MGVTVQAQGGGRDGQGGEGGPPDGGEGGPPSGGNDGPPQGTQPGGAPDFAAAATLGVSEDDLRNALGAPPPDFEAAAATLGVTVEALQEALGGAAPPGGPPPGASSAIEAFSWVRLRHSIDSWLESM